MLKGEVNDIKHKLWANVELFSVLCYVTSMPKAVIFGVGKVCEILNPC